MSLFVPVKSEQPAPVRPVAAVIPVAGREEVHAPAPAAPTPEQILEGARVLSDAGGPWEAGPEERPHLVYTDRGLFVSDAPAGIAQVLNYAERLRRRGEQFAKYTVSIEAISAAYRRGVKAGGRAAFAGKLDGRQEDVLSLVREALEEGASDMHFVIGRTESKLKFRVLGELETRHAFNPDNAMGLVSCLYNSMLDQGEQNFNPEASQRGRLNPKYTIALGLYGARIQTRPTHDGLLFVMRLLKSDDKVWTHEELGFLPQQIALMDELAACPFGITFISGPTGSGKSRTLQSTMTKLIQAERGRTHVLTIEDPPEYPIQGATVTPLNVPDRNDPRQVSKAWQDSISEAMRLDPDTILVGEVSDLGSAKTCISAAKTGHGVWTTLHANDATSIPWRLVDMELARADVLDPSVMIGFMAQRLLPTLCPDCKVPLGRGRTRLRPSTFEHLRAVSPGERLEGVHVRGPGCATCHGRGITSRRPVIEVIRTTPEFMREFESGGSLGARRFWVNSMGGITMLRHALELVWAGLVDPADAESGVQPLNYDETMLGADYSESLPLV